MARSRTRDDVVAAVGDPGSFLQNEGISPEGTFPTRGIEIFGARPLMLA